MVLDPDAAYRVLQTHDARFDGRLFVGVTSTRIYCPDARTAASSPTPRWPSTTASAPACAAGPSWRRGSRWWIRRKCWRTTRRACSTPPRTTPSR
jgi:Metal binding domain of Ada